MNIEILSLSLRVVEGVSSSSTAVLEMPVSFSSYPSGNAGGSNCAALSVVSAKEV
jgi:hypothetical protein